MVNTEVWAGRDLLLPKEQEVTQFGELQIPALDQKNWKRAQSMFSWITLACQWDVPGDSYGRPGWFTSMRIVPIHPGVSRFPPSQGSIYVVFEIPSLDAPMQMNADWYRLGQDGTASHPALGKDAQYLDMNDGYGYLEIRPPKTGWTPGPYLIKVYISSPGQQIHALSQVGTMKFDIDPSPDATQVCAENAPR